jgi:hypothetical protein
MRESEKISTALGFLVAIVMAGVMFAASGLMFAEFSWATDKSGILGDVHATLLVWRRDVYAALLIGLLGSALVTLLVGVPAFAVLRRLDLVRWWSAVATGFVSGAIVAIKTKWPEHGFADVLELKNWSAYAVCRVLAFGAMGGIPAFTFWFIWKRGRAGPLERDGA